MEENTGISCDRCDWNGGVNGMSGMVQIVAARCPHCGASGDVSRRGPPYYGVPMTRKDVEALSVCTHCHKSGVLIATEPVRA